MKMWLAVCASPALLLGFLLFSTASGGSARAAAEVHSPCGPVMVTHDVPEAPSVHVDALPMSDTGERELILAVHQDKDRFCYHYWQDGRERIGAPAIHVYAGEHFAVRVVNDITAPSKGERIAASRLPKCAPMPMAMMQMPVQHYVGYLNHIIDDRYMHVADVDTNIHFHGFEGPAEEDDAFLSTLSTPMHACEYHLDVPLTQPPGTYFYHPHAHGMSDDEESGGLAGAWIVDPKSNDIPASDQHLVAIAYAYPFTDDYHFFSDQNIRALARDAYAHEAARKPGSPIVTYDPFDPPDWPTTFPVAANGATLETKTCTGGFIEPVASVNGAAAPARMTLGAGRTHVLQLLNEMSDSPKLVSMVDSHGTHVPLRVAEIDGRPVGGDNAHPFATFLSTSTLMIPPAGRASVLLDIPASQTFTLRFEHYCSGYIEGYMRQLDVLELHGSAAETDANLYPARELSEGQSPAARMMAYVEAHRASIHRRAITFTEYGFPKNGKVPRHGSYFITDTTNRNFHEHVYSPVYGTDGAPQNPDIVVKQGTIEEWYLINAGIGHHSFHIHQMAFVLERGPAGEAVEADTTWIPGGKLRPNPKDPGYPLIHPSITKVIMDFRHVPKGTFVFHCHMLFHEDHGMMGTIRVV